MKRLFYLLLLASVLLTACTGGEHRRALDTAYVLINDRPDSALAILDSLEPSAQDLSRRQLRRWQLLRLMAQNKCDTVFRSDSLQRALTDYYDRHGTPNEQMWAHYLLGRAYYDMGEMPMALREYLSAEEKADTLSDDCDFRTLMSVHGQTAFVYRTQSMSKEEEEELMKYSRLAHQVSDTYNWIRGYEMTIGTHYDLGDTAECIRITEECHKLYEDNDMHREAASVYPTAIYIYLKSAKYEKARQLMDIFEEQSGLFDSQGNIASGREEYYYSQGLYRLGHHQPDSALIYFNKLLNKHLRNDVLAYKGMLSAYNEKHAYDSIVKYAALYEKSLDKFLEEDHAETMAQMTAMHRYGRLQKMAYEKKAEAERVRFILTLTVIAGICLLLAVFLAYRKYKKNKQDELNDQVERYRSLMNRLLRAEGEKSLLEDNHSELLSRKEEEISSLVKQMEGMKATIDSLSSHDRIELLENNDVVLYIKKKVTPRVPKGLPSEKDWKKLLEVVKKNLPRFYAFISHNKKLSNQEMKVCLLTYLLFSNTEMSVLLDTSKQTISNAKTKANFKLFEDKNAETLLSNLRNLIKHLN